MVTITKLHARAYNHLNDFQKEIFDECIAKGSGGLSLPKGSGKTFLSTVVALYQTEKPILVVCAKSLIPNWKAQLEEHFDGKLKYELAYSGENRNLKTWKLDPETRVVITTPDHLANVYKSRDLREHLIDQVFMNQLTYTNVYSKPSSPPLHIDMGVESLFSRVWGCLIIDESQNHCKISSQKAQALCTILADHTWLTSGDLIPTSHAEKIFGYYLLLDEQCPRNLPDFKRWIRGQYIPGLDLFLGLATTTVHRDKNEAFHGVTLLKKIVTHSMSQEERSIYTAFQEIIRCLNEKIKALKAADVHGEELKSVSSYILAMISYLRQSLVSPVLPLANLALKWMDSKNRDDFSKMIQEELEKLDLYSWLNTEDCVMSSRFKKVLELLALHDEKVVIFTSYRTSISLMQHFLGQEDREIFTLESSMSSKKRGIVLQEFEDSDNGILLLTYSIGGEGLNLQFARICILVDYEWSGHITDQAICRVFRMGQQHKEVLAYFMTSGTGIESSILQRQFQQQQIVKELFMGVVKSSVKSVKLADMIKMVLAENNQEWLQKVYAIEV